MTRLAVQDVEELRNSLLGWYDSQSRPMPWRVEPIARAAGQGPDPYSIWLSEIMLQQTTVASVKPYFEKFVTAFPTVEALASAEQETVLSHWAGLGYYARARNLHAAAKTISAMGAFPRSAEALEEIKGIGPYTAAAIASIAFDEAIVPVDGNVERVLSRLLLIEDELPAAKPVFRRAAAQFASSHRPGDFAQALMDLGATVCTPRSPSCSRCPWLERCAATKSGRAEGLPRKAKKKAKPVRYGACFLHLNEAGIWVRRRPDKGLLGGMLELPGTSWSDYPVAIMDALLEAPLQQINWIAASPIRHIFTHFELNLLVFAARETPQTEPAGSFMRIAIPDIEKVALPSLMLKAVRSGLEALGI